MCWLGGAASGTAKVPSDRVYSMSCTSSRYSLFQRDYILHATASTPPLFMSRTAAATGAVCFCVRGGASFCCGAHFFLVNSTLCVRSGCCVCCTVCVAPHRQPPPEPMSAYHLSNLIEPTHAHSTLHTHTHSHSSHYRVCTVSLVVPCVWVACGACTATGGSS